MRSLSLTHRGHFNLFLDVKPREDVSHNHNYTHVKKTKKKRERDSSWPIWYDSGNEQKLDSNFDVKCTPVQFYSNSHNSQSNRWIRLKLYVESPDMFSQLSLTFHVNRSLVSHRNTGSQRLYKFYYLLPFDLWTSLFG
jgi:hypothetical protein